MSNGLNKPTTITARSVSKRRRRDPTTAKKPLFNQAALPQVIVQINSVHPPDSPSKPQLSHAYIPLRSLVAMPSMERRSNACVVKG